MVNEKPSTKALIIARLRELAGEPVSGERLASYAGVSRVAVWKAAEALRAAGYPIIVDEDGYRLDPEGPSDFLYPWEFPERESRFRHWEETESTMDRARELADRGAPSGTIVVAERQSAGRGRGGRSWSSDDGGLFFTLLQDGGEAIQRYARRGMAVQVATARAIRREIGIQVAVRWPNDVYVKGRKIAGILTELRGEADRIRWIGVGVGINVNNRPPWEKAVSCADFVHHRLSRRQLLMAVLAELEGDAGVGAESADLVGAWNELDDTRGSAALVIPSRHGETGSEPVRDRGRYLGVDGYGRALLETENGKIELEAGEASLVFES